MTEYEKVTDTNGVVIDVKMTRGASRNFIKWRVRDGFGLYIYKLGHYNVFSMDLALFYRRQRDCLFIGIHGKYYRTSYIEAKMKIYLLRHGQTYFHVEDKLGGDSLLTPKGIKEAESLSELLCDVKLTVIYSSTLKRDLPRQLKLYKNSTPELPSY